MRTVTYASVLEKVSLLWSGQREPSVDEAAELNIHINRRARDGWEAAWWRELMVVERRQFRPSYNPATSYTAQTEVYYPPTELYYQAIKASNSGNPQAPADGNGTLNEAYWYESASDYSADDWLTGTVYAVGDVVFDPLDESYWACHTAHTSAGLTLDATKWTELTAFVRSLDPEETGETEIGEVRRAWREDPAVTGTADWEEVTWINGDLVVRGSTPVVWLEFRLRVPVWSGDAYSAATTYGVGDQVWDSTSGDYWKSLTAGNTGNAVAAGSHWDRIELPYVLSEFIAQGAYADAVRADGRPELFALENAEAQRLLYQAQAENDRRGGTARRLPVSQK